jgi:pyruvate dehydrogenase E2 component (dihydrolipoamide acetyltransferase)
MLNKIIMPSGGQTTDELHILKWYKSIGDFIKRGDLLFEIETDKATISVESYAEGTLLEVKYHEGELVRTGEIVAYIGDVGEKLQEDNKIQSGKPYDDGYQPTIEKKEIRQSREINLEKSHLQKDKDIIYASPMVKNMARTENIKIEDVANFVSKNLIKKDDIDNYIKNIKISNAKEDFYLIDTTSMRKTIAKRMKESISLTPHHTESIDIDMTEAIILRKKLNEFIKSDGIKVSYNDILMKVAAKAVELYPLINSTYQGEKIKIFKNVNFGLAVGLENGLIVTVVKQVNKKSIMEIAEANIKNIEKVKINKLLESDISGGTITLSNLGMFGINNFTAIINPPESCILAVGGIIEKPVVVDRKIVIRDIMNITGSFDHRVIDGALGAAFLQRIKTILENPQLLLLLT